MYFVRYNKLILFKIVVGVTLLNESLIIFQQLNIFETYTVLCL